MRIKSKTYTGVGANPAIPLDYRAQVFAITCSCEISAGATLTYSVQYTVDNIQDPTVTPVWNNLSTITNQTASAVGTISFPVTAIRVNITAFTNGSVKLAMVMQSGQG